jgi:hypothetical protein
MSIDTSASVSFWTSIFAAVTHWLPGPNILSTLGTDSVPYASAATAWAPPAFRTADAPTRFATYITSGEMLPSGRGGVARTISWHPATWAGMPSIRAVEGRMAVPPGT